MGELAIDLTGLGRHRVAVDQQQHEISELREGAKRAHEAIMSRRKSGEIGFLDLPIETAALHESRSVLAALPSFERTVVLGMGGSSLGPTPLLARGATDQHSMLQLFADRPDDKIHLFVAPSRRPTLKLSAETVFGSGDGFDHLVGRDLGELIDAQLEGTTSSLASRGRPTARLTLDSVGASALGELLFFQAATAFAGPMLSVDPFDQPGVEEAKVLAFAALGRDGFADRAIAPIPSEPHFVF